MPELPEVETVIRGLIKTVGGKTIESVKVNYDKYNLDNQPGWAKKLPGCRITGIRRRGKNILIDLDNDHTLWVHLKMTGHFYFFPKTDKTGKHDLMIFNLKGNGHNLRFNDYRRFGRIRLYRTGEVLNQKGLVELGPEPLEISTGDFVALFKTSRRMIKPALLDQTFLAGLGNIYADESLFAAKINPRRLTDSISSKKLVVLHGHIKRLLNKAISKMGTSVDSFAGVNGQTGRFQKYLLVYGREGEPCPNCGTKIRREKIGSRSAHYCLRCQRR